MNIKNINNFNPLRKYISSLIDNINKNYIPNNIDLILDGGAFNGAYQYGILLYLRELQYLNLLNIKQISGCSVGALMGALYLTNCLDKGFFIYEILLKSFRKSCFLSDLSNIIIKFINENVDNIEVLNDKLFITYHDMVTMKQVIISHYESKDHLIQVLIKSSFIPFLIDGKFKYKDRYCDGLSPYIFPKTERKILYINLVPLKKLKNTLYIKNETNIWPRLLYGIEDINSFFLGHKSEFCSYIENWKLIDFLCLRIREISILVGLTTINWIVIINNYLPDNIKNNIYLLRFIEILKTLYKDIFSYLIL